MPYIFGKLWHLAIIWAIRKAFQCILQGVRFLLAKQTRLSGTSDNESYFHRKVFFFSKYLYPGPYSQLTIMVTHPGYLQSFFHQVKVVFMLGLAGDDELEDEGEAEQRNRYRRCHHFIIYIFWTLFPAPSLL